MRFCSMVGQASIQTARASGPSTIERSSGLLPALGIQAPGPRPGGGDIEPNKAEHDGGMPLVDAEQVRLPRRPFKEETWCGHDTRLTFFSEVKGIRPPVDSHEPPRISINPTMDVGPRCSSSTTTPSSTATSGLMYVMTLARLGPASVMSRKNTTSPSAVQTTPSTAMAHSADGGIACGGLASTAGSSATVDRARLAATGPSGSTSARRRLTMMGAAA